MRKDKLPSVGLAWSRFCEEIFWRIGLLLNLPRTTLSAKTKVIFAPELSKTLNPLDLSLESVWVCSRGLKNPGTCPEGWWPYKVCQPREACIKAGCLPRPSTFWFATFGVFFYHFSSLKTHRNTIFLCISTWICIKTLDSFRSKHGCSLAQYLWYYGGAWAKDFSWEGA